MDLKKPHYIAIQPYNRESQFYTLAEWRMKDILQNHYKTIEKHSKKLMIETVYSLGMAETEYVQIVRFEPKDIILFHEFINDITKVNSPFINFKETVMGIGEMENGQKKRQFLDQKRLVSILYLSHSPGWWVLPDYERDQVIKKHAALLKKHTKQIDSNTIRLIGMSEPQFGAIFDYPFENAEIYGRVLNNIMKINSPYLEIKQVFTGIAGIGDYWLEQLKDVELKEVPMSKFSSSKWGIKS